CKDEKNYWVAQLQWQAGRSVIAAHWRYQPDAHGGSVVPLDDPATDLVDPDFGRALRGLATILPEPVTEPAPVEPAPAAPAPREEPAAPAARTSSQDSVEEYYEQRAAVGGSAVPVAAKATAPAPKATPANPPAPPANSTPAPVPAPATTPAPEPAPAAPPASTPPATTPAAPAAEAQPPAKPAAQKSNRGKRGKAPMPSWEDV
ncbi:septation protein SepH, partial [Nocardia gipuzkoensis]